MRLRLSTIPWKRELFAKALEEKWIIECFDFCVEQVLPSKFFCESVSAAFRSKFSLASIAKRSTFFSLSASSSFCLATRFLNIWRKRNRNRCNNSNKKSISLFRLDFFLRRSALHEKLFVNQLTTFKLSNEFLTGGISKRSTKCKVLLFEMISNDYCVKKRRRIETSLLWFSFEGWISKLESEGMLNDRQWIRLKLDHHPLQWDRSFLNSKVRREQRDVKSTSLSEPSQALFVW